MAPNCGIELSGSDDTRQGRKCKVQSIKKGANASAKTLREQTFQVNGPQLFNILPPYLRNLTKCPAEIFKEKLDQYLMKVPDEPSVPGLVPSATTPEARPSNSLLHQRPQLEGEEGQDLAPERSLADNQWLQSSSCSMLALNKYRPQERKKNIKRIFQ